MLTHSNFQILSGFIEGSNRCRSRDELDTVFRTCLAQLGIDMFAFPLIDGDFAGECSICFEGIAKSLTNRLARSVQKSRILHQI